MKKGKICKEKYFMFSVEGRLIRGFFGDVKNQVQNKVSEVEFYNS